MKREIKSELRQEMMREFGSMKNEVGSMKNEVNHMNKTMVNHCFRKAFILDDHLIWPFNLIFQFERTYMTMGGCDNYQTLNDPKRKVSFISSDRQNKQRTWTCDSSGHPEASPDWKGTNWYRFVSPAGTKVAERPPKSYGACNTGAPGWITGMNCEFLIDKNTR